MKKGFQFSSHPVSAYLVYTGEAPISIVGVCRYSKVAQALAKEKNAKIYFMDSANSMSGLNRKYRTKQIAPFGHTFVSYNYEAGQIEYAITYVYKKEAFNRIYSLENTIKSMNKMQNMNYDIELMESDDGNTASLYVDGKIYASVHKSKVYARNQYESYSADWTTFTYDGASSNENNKMYWDEGLSFQLDNDGDIWTLTDSDNNELAFFDNDEISGEDEILAIQHITGNPSENAHYTEDELNEKGWYVAIEVSNIMQPYGWNKKSYDAESYGVGDNYYKFKMMENNERMKRLEKMLKNAGVWASNPTISDYMKEGMNEEQAREMYNLNYSDELFATIGYLLDYAHKGGMKIKGYDAESYGADEDYEDYNDTVYIMTIVTKTDGRIEIERWETQDMNLKSFEKKVIKEFKELVHEADGNYADDLVSATLERESYSDYTKDKSPKSSKTIARYIHFDDDVMSKDEPHGFEIFNVEFNDWAKQEMLTHGEDISFKEWAQDESEKHGDMDLEDWAEHEEESHDERYGAERYWDKDTDSYREIYKHSIEVREFPKSSSVYQNGKLVKQYKGQGHFNNATAYAQKLENDYVPKSFFAEGEGKHDWEEISSDDRVYLTKSDWKRGRHWKCVKCGEIKHTEKGMPNKKGCEGFYEDEEIEWLSENMTSKLKSPYVIGAFAIGLGIPYITSFLNSKKDK